MDEIKYQVYTKDGKGITKLFDVISVYFNCINEEIPSYSVIYKNSKGYIESQFVSADKLRQYTGLTDKNGKEIFEGDIIRYSDGLFSDDKCTGTEVVIFTDGGFGTSERWLRDIIIECEVIGNIYENPQLIEESEMEEE